MSRREMGQLVRDLRKAGVRCTLTKSNHWRADAPGGPVYFPGTPSDVRAVANAKATLRRHGVDL